jgi:hypothetical protein
MEMRLIGALGNRVLSSSSAEAEFNALSEGLKELCWVNKLLEEMGVKVKTPISMHEDSQSCIHVFIGDWGQKRLRHEDMRYKFISTGLNKDS